MASRKEQKEQARARREALEHERERGQARARRLRGAGIAATVAAVAVVAAILVSSGGGGDDGGEVRTGSDATEVVAAVNLALAGAEQSGTRLGRAGAPVSIDYYGDLQCPVCRAFTEGSLGEVIRDHVVPGKLRVVFRSLQTATADPTTFAQQQVAALAAGRQDRLWQYAELFYRQQGQEGTGYATEDFLTGIARQVPDLDLDRWRRDRRDAALARQVRTDATAASVAGATATPTLVVKGPRGTRSLTGNVPADEVAGAIAAVS